MPLSIAISGKGGTGKTTLVALLLRELLRRGKSPVLVIDADHDGNLAGVLGIKGGRTVGEVLEEMQRKVSDFPPGFSKDQWLEAKVAEVIVEQRGYDFLSMGRGEGPGCYCYVNSVLRKIMDLITRDYPYILMDNAAGMEHLSRRTTRNVDVLLVVSDHSMKGLESSRRIAELAKELELEVGRLGLVINRAPGEVDQRLLKELEASGLELYGVIPEDEEIKRYDLERRSLLELPDGNRAAEAVRGVLEKATKSS